MVVKEITFEVPAKSQVEVQLSATGYKATSPSTFKVKLNDENGGAFYTLKGYHQQVVIESVTAAIVSTTAIPDETKSPSTDTSNTSNTEKTEPSTETKTETVPASLMQTKHVISLVEATDSDSTKFPCKVVPKPAENEGSSSTGVFIIIGVAVALILGILVGKYLKNKKKAKNNQLNQRLM